MALVSKKRLRRSPAIISTLEEEIKSDLDKVSLSLTDIQAQLDGINLELEPESCAGTRTLLEESQLPVVRAMLAEEIAKMKESWVDLLLSIILRTQDNVESLIDVPTIAPPVEGLGVDEAPRLVEEPCVDPSDPTGLGLRIYKEQDDEEDDDEEDDDEGDDDEGDDDEGDDDKARIVEEDNTPDVIDTKVELVPEVAAVAVETAPAWAGRALPEAPSVVKPAVELAKKTEIKTGVAAVKEVAKAPLSVQKTGAYYSSLLPKPAINTLQSLGVKPAVEQAKKTEIQTGVAAAKEVAKAPLAVQKTGAYYSSLLPKPAVNTLQNLGVKPAVEQAKKTEIKTGIDTVNEIVKAPLYGQRSVVNGTIQKPKLEITNTYAPSSGGQPTAVQTAKTEIKTGIETPKKVATVTLNGQRSGVNDTAEKPKLATSSVVKPVVLETLKTEVKGGNAIAKEVVKTQLDVPKSGVNNTIQKTKVEVPSTGVKPAVLETLKTEIKGGNAIAKEVVKTQLDVQKTGVINTIQKPKVEVASTGVKPAVLETAKTEVKAAVKEVAKPQLSGQKTGV